MGDFSEKWIFGLAARSQFWSWEHARILEIDLRNVIFFVRFAVVKLDDSRIGMAARRGVLITTKPDHVSIAA